MPISSAARDYSRRLQDSRAHQVPKAQYDFSRFEAPSGDRRKGEKAKTGNLRVVETSARELRNASARKWFANITVMALIVVPLAVLMLYSQAVLATINEDIGVKNDELNTLTGEYTRLQTELEAKISLKNIEEYAATTLGMTKVGQDQVQYVNVEQGESVTLYSSSGESSLTERFRRWISKTFGHNRAEAEIG